MGIRRVVTGQLEDGKSVFVDDQILESVSPPLMPGNKIWQIWGDDGVPQLPTTGQVPPYEGFFAPRDGHRVIIYTVPPSTYVAPEPEDFAAALAETDRMVPGMTSAVTDPEGRHATDTVDFLYILEGEIALELDPGEETLLKAGDCIIQNGTSHAWYNRNPEKTCKLLLVFVGAERTT